MMWSKLGGTLPAPLFIFLSGVSFALVTGRLRAKGVSRSEIARTTIKRGAEIYGLGLLFRIQEFALGYPWAPWTDLLRVDVLNILGLSMMLMGILCWACGAGNAEETRKKSLFAALAAAAIVALVTPPLWTTYRPRWLPWFLESYVNGVHTFKEPQPWLFPLFPWVAFAFAGLATGFVVFSDYARKREALVISSLGAGGVAAYFLGLRLDALPVRLYAVYDFWHTSPNFFLVRCGVLLALLFLAYVSCFWGVTRAVLSPLIQLGKTSLLVYWVHIEFVYGRFSILPKGKCSIPRASAGLLAIFLAMLLLSLLRTGWKSGRLRAWLPGAKNPAAAAESG